MKSNHNTNTKTVKHQNTEYEKERSNLSEFVPWEKTVPVKVKLPECELHLQRIVFHFMNFLLDFHSMQMHQKKDIYELDIDVH